MSFYRRAYRDSVGDDKNDQKIVGANQLALSFPLQMDSAGTGSNIIKPTQLTGRIFIFCLWFQSFSLISSSLPVSSKIHPHEGRQILYRHNPCWDRKEIACGYFIVCWIHWWDRKHFVSVLKQSDFHRCLHFFWMHGLILPIKFIHDVRNFICKCK